MSSRFDSGDRDGPSFPTEEQIQEVTAQELGDVPIGENQVGAEQWALQGPIPTSLGTRAVAPVGQWEQRLVEVVDSDDVVLSESMRCASRELANFLLEHDAMPDNRVSDFITWRCNVPAFRTHSQYATESGFTESQLFSHWGPNLGEWVGELSENSEVGIAVAENESGEIAVVLSRVTLSINIDQLPAQVSSTATSFRLTGTVLEDSDSAWATVNRGAYDSDRCEPVEGVQHPAFAFDCPIDAADDATVIGVSILPPGRFMGRVVSGATIYREGAAPLEYRQRDSEARPVDGARDAGETFVAVVNSIRAEAGRDPVVLDLGQTAVAPEWAPHYFAAGTGLLPEAASDILALGMLAGRHVDGRIVDGDIMSYSISGTRDVAELVEAAVAYPGFRALLLDPDIDRLAVGTAFRGESDALGTLVTGYTCLGESTREEDAELVRSRLGEARAEAGMPAARRLRGAEEMMARALHQLEHTQRDFGDILDDFVEEVSNRYRVNLWAWYVITRDLDEFDLPSDLVTSREINLDIGVAQIPPDSGDPWGSYLVIFLHGGAAGSRLASLPLSPTGPLEAPTAISGHDQDHREQPGRVGARGRAAATGFGGDP